MAVKTGDGKGTQQANPPTTNPAPGKRTMTLPESLAALRELHRAKRLVEARELGQAVLNAAPGSAEANMLAAATEMMSGRPDLALPLAERAAQLEPSNPERVRVLGKVLRALGREAEAASVLERAADLYASRPPGGDPGAINRGNPTHHLQHRPISHVKYRRSKHFDALLAAWLDPRMEEADDLGRFYFLADNVARTLARGIEGALAELGVWRGHSAKVLTGMAPGRTLYLFDTFAGFLPGELPANDSRREMYRDTSLDLVKSYVGTDHVTYCPGMFPDSAAKLPAALRFALVHIDCKLKLPVKAGLEFFYPRLNPGGLLIVHDYANDDWSGVGQAVDEFLADKPEGMVLIPDKGGSAVLTKG
jgi:O-methyltransferase